MIVNFFFTRLLTIPEVNKVTKLFQNMQNKSLNGKNTVRINSLTISNTRITLNISYSNQQTSNQFLGSLKGSLGKCLEQGIVA
jgi:hypothetical protein